FLVATKTTLHGHSLIRSDEGRHVPNCTREHYNRHWCPRTYHDSDEGTNSAAMGERDTGPKHLLITYHCPAASRSAFHDYMINQGVPAFQDWKRTGVVGDYYILFSWFVDSDTWDMLSILSFNQYAAVDKW